MFKNPLKGVKKALSSLKKGKADDKNNEIESYSCQFMGQDFEALDGGAAPDSDYTGPSLPSDHDGEKGVKVKVLEEDKQGADNPENYINFDVN